MVVGDEGVDERGALIKWRVECGEWRVKIVVEGFGEVGGEGGLGRGGDEAAFLEVEEGFAGRMVVEGLDAEMAGDGEEEGDG